jgi:hypothetical protein
VSERPFSRFDRLHNKLSAILVCGLGVLGVSSVAGCSEDPLRSKKPKVIKDLPPTERYIHDYVGDDEIGDDCMRGTDYALVANVNGKVVQVARIGQIVNKAGDVTAYTVTPAHNPNNKALVTETQVLTLLPEPTGTKPLPGDDDASKAVLAKYSCSTSY